MTMKLILPKLKTPTMRVNSRVGSEKSLPMLAKIPEIPKSGAEYNDEFGLKVLDAMSELDGIGLSKEDDMGTTIQKFKRRWRAVS